MGKGAEIGLDVLEQVGNGEVGEFRHHYPGIQP